jgi:hypothetical protein
MTTELLLQAVTRYWGVDWALAVFALASIFFLGDKRRLGFAVGMASCVLGIIFSWQIGSIANAITSTVLLAMYLRGWIKWRPTASALTRAAS